MWVNVWLKCSTPLSWSWVSVRDPAAQLTSHYFNPHAQILWLLLLSRSLFHHLSKESVFPKEPQGEFPVPLHQNRREEEEEKGKVGGEERWNVRAEGLCLVIAPLRREGGSDWSRKPLRRRWNSQRSSSFRKSWGDGDLSGSSAVLIDQEKLIG